MGVAHPRYHCPARSASRAPAAGAGGAALCPSPREWLRTCRWCHGLRRSMVEALQTEARANGYAPAAGATEWESRTRPIIVQAAVRLALLQLRSCMPCIALHMTEHSDNHTPLKIRRPGCALVASTLSASPAI